MRSSLLLVAAAFTSAFAKTITITVGKNATGDPSEIFSPQHVVAEQYDVVYFNFTQGNHSVIQSSFSSPCTPIHLTNSTINGFDSGFRDTVNGTAITNLQVVVYNPNDTIWFFDWTSCGGGGVGAINVNESSWETFDGFVRNAIRLNGTGATDTTTTSATATRTTPANQPTNGTTSSATRSIIDGATLVVPALFMLLAVSL